MATIKYKDSLGEEKTVTFAQELGVDITVDSDKVEYVISTTSPTINEKVDYIGGRPRRD